jgi:flagellar basal body-associated protein FliL
MEKTENKENGLIQSQRSLYTKFKRINRLFKIHISSLTLLFLLALGYIILWTYLVFTGQTIPELSQIYGLFGTIVTIFLTTVLSLLIVQIGIQIIFYGLFIIRGNRSLKQTKEDKTPRTTPYDGIVPYITNFYAFFNRYSKQKITLVKRVKTFLFFNFFSGFLVVFLSTRILDTGSANVLINISMVIIFLFLLFFWFMSLMTSFKIQKEIVRWEKLFPKLEEWAQELGQSSLENSKLFDEEAPP